MMTDAPTELVQFAITEPADGYWRIVFSNPPINLLNSRTVIEVGEIVRRIEEANDLRVVVFASDHPDFFMARYDLSDTDPVAFAPTASGVTYFIDSMRRMNDGWINRAIPDAELDDYVDTLARRLASFDATAVAAAKRLVNRHAGVAPVDDYRETLHVLRELIVSPSTGARRGAVAARAQALGAEFELRMGALLDLR
jgi:enoyl-CoA hydratase/carnithine racemase